MLKNNWVDGAIDLAVPLIKQFEGYRAEPYLCSAGVWTIGWGTTRIAGTPVSASTPPCNPEQAHAWLIERLRVDAAKLLRTGHISQPHQLAALLSFSYNAGTGALFTSTLWRLHKQGRFEEAAEQFGRWIWGGGKKLPGLILRREFERRLYAT